MRREWVPGVWAAAAVAVTLMWGCHRQQPADTGAEAAPPKGASTAAAPAKAPEAKSITVFAGAAAMAALKELGPMYETKTGIKVDITSGGSGSVMTQFVQEQFGDVYMPGSDDFMDKAEAKDAVLKDTRAILVYLVPAICISKGNPKGIKSLDDLARADLRVVLGEEKAVCLGDIAAAVLKEKGLAEKVQPRVASYASSCEDVLNKLLLGEADVVIGWDSFAKQNPDKVETIPIQAESARVRHIPAAVIKWSTQRDAAKAFIDFLTSPDAMKVWEARGYTTKAPESVSKGT
ncbi:MAG TPA: molybdate ABC transporter substrate-binding protein [Armatimonadota bacterium]|nr:molybdate ABC transporter substrate-binding protein [Armatimonadota bacterium]HQK92759.1 molybdate ABC transporter substrate-binding protein [Armatimonadota bacterium]